LELGVGVVTGAAAMTMAASENRQAIPMTFALCPACQRTAELAEQLVPDPAQHVARASVNCALDALSFLAPQTVAHMAYLDPEGLTALVWHLAQVGSAAAGSGRRSATEPVWPGNLEKCDVGHSGNMSILGF
jgi:hypothetical protein